MKVSCGAASGPNTRTTPASLERPSEEAPLRQLGVKLVLLLGLTASGVMWKVALWPGGPDPEPLLESPSSTVPTAAVNAAPSIQESPIRCIDSGWASRERVAALLEAMEADAEADEGGEAVEGALAAVALADVKELLALLQATEGPAATELTQRLVRRWADADASAAAAWLEQLPAGPQRRAALDQVALAWANADPVGAARWAQSLPEDERQAATLDVSYESARTDPLSALTLSARLAASCERDQMLVHGVAQWAATDPATATDWALAVPDLQLRQRLLGAVAVAAAETSPAAAATLIERQLSAGEEQDRASVALVQRWAQISPAAAATWVAQAPATEARLAATQSIAAQWAAKEPEDGARWLRELPAGPLQEAATTAFNQAIAEHAPGQQSEADLTAAAAEGGL